MNAVDNPPVASRTRCPACGRRSTVDQGSCVCGQDLPIALVLPENSQLKNEPHSAAAVGLAAFLSAMPQGSESQRLTPTAEAFPSEHRVAFSGSVARARVLIIRQAPNEPMDFDLWRWVAIPVWGLILLISPFIAAILVWRSFGILPALGVAACSLLVLRFIFSDRLLQSWHLTAALNGRHITEPMPVMAVRVRLTSGREIQVRLKGQVDGGSLIEGDRIAIFGRWRSGVLHATRIQCERTGAAIIPRQPCARRLALAGIVLLSVVSLWLVFAGVPWVSGQVQPFSSSINDRIQTINQQSYRP